MSSFPPPLPDRSTPMTAAMYADIFGGSLICGIFTLLLYGVSLLQTYMYFMRYVNDPIFMKSLVLGVWALGTLHTIMVCHTMYHYFILCYANPFQLIDGVWSVYTSVTVGIVTCFIVQTFFANMIFQLTRGWMKYSLAIVYTAMILGQSVFGILFVVKGFILWQLPKLSAVVDFTLAPMCILRVISDALTAVSLSLVLYDSRTNLKHSMRLVKALVIYAMERFILTTLVMLVQTTMLFAKPQSIWSMVIEEVTVHLYINSFLATLNARNHLRQLAIKSESASISLPEFATVSSRSRAQGGFSGPSMIRNNSQIETISEASEVLVIGGPREMEEGRERATMTDSQYGAAGRKVAKESDVMTDSSLPSTEYNISLELSDLHTRQ